MDEWLGDLMTSLSPVIRKAKHEILVECPPGIAIDSYPGALGQVLTNLLVNAVTHAYPEGESGRIADFKFDRFGIFTVTLTNGQVWQQNSSDETKARWRASPAQQAYNVVISEGILGSYNFKVINLPGTYKVRRIK